MPDQPNQPSNSTNEVVKALLDAKAVDFQAIGAVVAKYGATAAMTLDYEDVFCGTMRGFVHLVRIPTPGSSVENLPSLGSVSTHLTE
jgi:hypothetical protein